MKKDIEKIKPHLKKLFNVVFSDKELTNKGIRCSMIYNLNAIVKKRIEEPKLLGFEYKDGIEALRSINELIEMDENKFKEMILTAYDLYENGDL